jgi:hypothetical protein
MPLQFAVWITAAIGSRAVVSEILQNLADVNCKSRKLVAVDALPGVGDQ